MHNDSRMRLVRGFLPALILAFGLMGAEAQTPPNAHQAKPAIVCRVLEAKAVEQPAAALVLFHHAEMSDRDRLGELLRQHEGAKVEFESADGQSHTATLLRLGTCFGRGLLVFPSGSAHLAKGEQFRLKFPEETHRSP